jgi:hypothetical protein
VSMCVGVFVGEGRVNEGDEGEGTWLITLYTYTK